MDLNKTRAATEVVSAITWVEIQAFSEAQGLLIRPWEKQLLRDIDDIAIDIWSKKKTIREPTNEVDVGDSAGVGSFLRGLAAKVKGG
jgi:hypothetical protein